jgi:hypothetical protein
MKILSVGIDTTTRALLKRAGIDCISNDLANVEEVHEWVRDSLYDAILVDLDAVKWGTMAVRYLRSCKVQTPFVGLTIGGVESWSEFRAAFLEQGGDDLIHSPANPRELAASLRTVTRRNSGLALDVVEFTRGDSVIRVNLSLQRVTVNGIQPKALVQKTFGAYRAPRVEFPDLVGARFTSASSSGSSRTASRNSSRSFRRSRLFGQEVRAAHLKDSKIGEPKGTEEESRARTCAPTKLRSR